MIRADGGRNRRIAGALVRVVERATPCPASSAGTLQKDSLPKLADDLGARRLPYTCANPKDN